MTLLKRYRILTTPPTEPEPDPNPPPVTRERGIVLNTTSFGSLNDFAQVGGITASVTSGKINLSGGTGTLTRYLTYTPYVDSDEKAEITVEYTHTGAGGLAIGKRSTNTTFARHYSAALDHATGQSKIYDSDGNVLMTSAQSINMVAGNIYRLVFALGTTSTVTAYNVTAGTSCTASESTQKPNMGRIAIYTLGGTQSISTFKVNRRSLINPDLIVLGDSKTKGVGANVITNRWATHLATLTGKTVEVWAGSGDKTAEVLAGLSQVIAAQPKEVLLCVGRNDLAFSITAGTWQANYASIVGQLKAAGIKVTHLMPLPESTQNQTTLHNYIDLTYPSDTRLTVSNGWNNTTMLADGIHPDDDGHFHIGVNLAVHYVEVPNQDEFVGPFASWVNVKTQFSAVGDGVADDTAALQAALDFVSNANTSNATVYLPKGTYRITTGLQFHARLYKNIIGESLWNTKIVYDGTTSTDAMLWMNGTSNGKFSRITFDGQVKINDCIRHEWDGVGQYVTHMEWSDCVFLNAKMGLRGGVMGSSGPTAEFSVKRCKFINMTISGVSVEEPDSLDWWIRDCFFAYCYDGVTSDPNTPQGGAGNFHVYDSTFFKSTSCDIHVQWAQGWGLRRNVSVSSKQFFQADGVGNNAAPVTIIGNRILNSTQKKAIQILNRGPLTLINNQFVVSGPGTFEVVEVYCDTLSIDNQFEGFTGTVTPLIVGAGFGKHREIRTKDAGGNAIQPLIPAAGTVSRKVVFMQGMPPHVTRQIFDLPAPGTDEPNVKAVQAVFDQAVAAGNKAIVHIRPARYNIKYQLVIPPLASIQVIGDSSASLLDFGLVTVTPGHLLSCMDGRNLVLRDFRIAGGTRRTSGIRVRLPVDPAKIVHLTSVVSKFALEEYAYDFRNLGGMKLELHDCQHQYNSPNGSIRMENVHMRLFGGASSVNGRSYDIINSTANIQDTWYESTEDGTFMELSGNSNVSLNTCKVYSGTVPTGGITLNNYTGKFALTAANVNCPVKVQGDCTGAKVLVAGNKFWPASYLQNTATGSPLVVAMNTQQGASTVQAVADIGSMTDAQILEMFDLVMNDLPEYKTKPHAFRMDRVVFELGRNNLLIESV